jgi:hypothetical protein
MKWLVELAFESERDAQEFTDSVALTGGVEVPVGGTWQRHYAAVERGPHLADGERS